MNTRLIALILILAVYECKLVFTFTVINSARVPLVDVIRINQQPMPKNGEKPYQPTGPQVANAPLAFRSPKFDENDAAEMLAKAVEMVSSEVDDLKDKLAAENDKLKRTEQEKMQQERMEKRRKMLANAGMFCVGCAAAVAFFG